MNKPWSTYTNPLKKKSSNHSNAIINCLGELAADFFEQKRGVRTRAIKLALVNLGHKVGYKVYANGLAAEDLKLIDQPFVNREWLFDLHWYTDGTDAYSIKFLPLVAECEWNPKRKGDAKIYYGGVKYDFQKLLVANAALRLMIFTITGNSDLEKLESYFQGTINNYAHLDAGAKFLFVAFNNKSKCFYYKKMKKRSNLYIMEMLTTLFRAKLTTGLADFWVAANAIKACTKIVI